MTTGSGVSAGVQVQSAPAVGTTRRRGYNGKLSAYLGLTLGFALSAFPLYYMLVLAMDKRGGIAVMAWPPVLTPYWPLQFDNFIYALTAVNFGRYFLNSTLISTLVVIGTILSSSVAGYVFGRMRFHGRDALFIVMLATMMIPTQVTLIPQFILFRAIGWYDHPLWFPLWIPAFTGAPLAIFLFRQFFMTMPAELEDAGKIDGANPFKIFWSIFLPLCKPIVATIAILYFLATWHDLLGPIVYINEPDRYTVAVGLALFESEFVIDIPALMAASVVAIVPPVTVFFFAQNYFVRGVVLTGLKG